VGSKCTLAARVDACHESTDGHIGQEFREEINKKIEKLQEPPPVKAVKALPTPIEAPKKKRGGRRVRKMKERYQVTETRKLKNRMNFGELEEDVYQNDLGYTRGNIGKSSIGGGIRMAAVDERTKVRISQTLKRNLQKQQATWGGTTSIKKHISGTASSVAFTPLQVSCAIKCLECYIGS
jgi:U4/U6 small nuclear ribonucleoprotein PRP31